MLDAYGLKQKQSTGTLQMFMTPKRCTNSYAVTIKLVTAIHNLRVLFGMGYLLY